MFRAFETLFLTFLSEDVETIFWESKISLQNCYKIKFPRGSLLENNFKATLRSKTNALSVWKWHFLRFCNCTSSSFLNDKIENFKNLKNLIDLKNFYIKFLLYIKSLRSSLQNDFSLIFDLLQPHLEDFSIFRMFWIFLF